ncbi:MAG: PAS domain-containing protein [Desulfobacula sp.]|nr:PAS domain-containing protein [Desulfobacula sp.]
MEIMKKKDFPLISPLLFVGILLILLPIFTFMTFDRLKKQKEFIVERYLEKGISLIRTFEAGTRTGLFTMGWGAQRIQTMLHETSLQPEIVYMMITSKDGKILAHSDTSMVGEIFHDMPANVDIKEDVTLFSHRERLQKGEGIVFEVFKRFTPMQRKFKGKRRHRSGMSMHNDNKDSNMHKPGMQFNDWCQSYLQNRDGNNVQVPRHYIFAGLSMERAKIARARLLKATIWRGFSFFVLGCVGIIALFSFQAYRSARASLTRVKAFSDNVIENMPSGLVTINLDHEITSMNKTAKEILGNDLSHSLPRLIELMDNPENLNKVISQEITLAAEQGKTRDTAIGLDITASPIQDSENQITGFLFLFKDLTQIKKLKKQVETNRRLAAIGKLAAGVAHEIRNPLSSIKGFATYFGKRYEKNSPDKQTAQIMVKEVERINRSITQLLEFAKPMKIEKKPVNINDLINHSLKLVHHDMVQKKIQTKVDINLKTPVIHTDGDRMNQVLLNLYINAVQAMEENGKLAVSVLDKSQEGLVEIRIKDTGEGIDKDYLDLIFDPYFTSRPEGTGLGLSIVHTIIENLQGSIRVKSTKGKGTCFIINLPV